MDAQFSVISHVRSLFEQRYINPCLLANLYMDYNPIPEINLFITKSQSLFPRLNCGIASLYLKYILGEGDVVQGTYAGQVHTYLRLRGKIIVDITADQFEGPRIYRGAEEHPWSKDE